MNVGYGAITSHLRCFYSLFLYMRAFLTVYLLGLSQIQNKAYLHYSFFNHTT